jgi:Flp pilus assembly protein TadD
MKCLTTPPISSYIKTGHNKDVFSGIEQTLGITQARGNRMSLTDLQPYLTALSAGLGIATLGFLLNVVKTIRDNAQDRIAIQEERLKRAAEEQQRTEKWAEREKATLKEQINVAKAEMDALLKREGIDLNTLSLGKQLSESAVEVRATAQALVEEMKNKLAQLSTIEKPVSEPAKPDWELSLAMGTMAAGSYGEAATHFDSYATGRSDSWQAHFSRGVAHANSRKGEPSDIAALRAYNEAIALAPVDIDKNRRARLFSYRGAMLKRLSRLEEAEADIRIALSLADATHEVLDARYNLACIHALRAERELMFDQLSALKGSPQHLRAVAIHTRDYFARFAGDPEFLAVLNRRAT